MIIYNDIILDLILICKNQLYFAVFYIFVAYFFYKFTNQNCYWNSNNFIEYLFPSKITSKNSFKLDIQFYLFKLIGINGLINKILIYAFGIELISRYIAQFHLSDNYFSAFLSKQLGSNYFIFIFIFSFILSDLGGYVAHRIAHKVNFFWQFHKVHHFSEQINYFTTTRSHPIDSLLGTIISFLIMSLGLVFLVDFKGNYMLNPISFANNDRFLILAFYILPSFINNLHHSHFPIHYGKFLNCIFVSPVSHMIHHSSVIIGYNFGTTLNIWDKVLGTYYAPTDLDDINEHYNKLGVIEMGDTYYKNLYQILSTPFVDAFKIKK